MNEYQNSNISKYNKEGSMRSRHTASTLRTDYFKIDERVLADYLVFVEKYASNVLTHEDSVEYSTWESFFKNDVSVFMAKLSSVNLEDLLPVYMSEELIGGYESQMPILQKQWNTVKEISFILQKVPLALAENTQYADIFSLITQVKKQEILSSIDKFDFLKEPSQLAKDRWLKKEIEDLNKKMNNFLIEVTDLVYYSKLLFKKSITHDQNHTPGIALFIAFIQLYEYVQNDLNRITEKHLDYFYRQILNQKEKPALPDHVYVCFTLADYAEFCKIEKGEQFRAGIDEEGYDNLYAADDFLTVNKSKITDLGAVYLSHRNEVGMEDAYDYVSDILEMELLSSPTGGFDLSATPVSFAAFEGTENKGNDAIPVVKISEVGYSIASPVLLLREGKREVVLELVFETKSMKILLNFLERFTRKEKIRFDRIFHKLFHRTFNIFLTTEEGWYQIETYKLFSPSSLKGSFYISFEVPMGAPPIVGMGEKWDIQEKDLYQTNWPVIKLCLTNQKSMYVYSYLKDLVLKECILNVSVKGVKNLSIFNDLGQVDTTTPFFPFGSLPVLGSSLVVGCDELYIKKIEDFSFDLEWHNLPTKKGGWKEYYKEYDSTLENDAFKVAITALSDFEFYPTSKEKVKTYSLFETKNEQQGELPVLSASTTLQGFDLEGLSIHPDYTHSTWFPYSNKIKSGYIKMELVEPYMSFGHQMYPTIFSSKIIKGNQANKMELPNSPYTPQLKSLTLNYKASARIKFDTSSFIKSDPNANEKIMYLQPYGSYTIFQNNVTYSNYFLPNYSHRGYLLFGFDEIAINEPLTIYFILEPVISNEFDVELPEIDWFYVSNNRWKAFEKKDLIFDTTRNLTATGIVKLKIPQHIDNKNTVLPKNKYWIVAAVRKNIKTVAKLKGVYTQALRLSWTSLKKEESWHRFIPPHTIDSFVVPRSEILNIFQPQASFGGREKESKQELYTRVSERLRHRNRCVTAWDYEQIVLQKFPFVNQVKCIAPVEYSSYINSGEVVLVVIPNLTKGSNYVLDRFDYNVLQEIKNYVEGYTSPFVRLQVINPVYEQVKISASIKFNDSLYAGVGIEKLHRDLHDFICPWYQDTTRPVSLGGSINLGDLEDFIASLDYIYYVTAVSILVLHYHNRKYSISDSVVASLKNKTLYASKPWSVLIPMQQHPIKIIESEVYLMPVKSAIENMKIGTDMVLLKNKKTNKKESDHEKNDDPQRYTMVEIRL